MCFPVVYGLGLLFVATGCRGCNGLRALGCRGCSGRSALCCRGCRGLQPFPASDGSRRRLVCRGQVVRDEHQLVAGAARFVRQQPTLAQGVEVVVDGAQGQAPQRGQFSAAHRRRADPVVVPRQEQDHLVGDKQVVGRDRRAGGRPGHHDGADGQRGHGVLLAGSRV